MNAGSSSARRLIAFNASSRDSICRSCLNRISHQANRRNASTATAVADQSPTSQSDPSSSQPVEATGPRKAFKIMCSPLIARPPLLTREPTSFEKAYYLYQKRLNERLVLPFTRYFYYKKGTPADLEWKRKYKVRRVAARDIGFYNAYDPNAWNDEVLVGSQLSEPADFVEKLCRDAEGKPIVDIAKDVSQEKVAELAADELGSGKRVVEEEKVESEADDIDVLTGESVKKTEKKIVIPRPLPRETEADRTNDLKSLNRKLDRSLYLLIKRKDGQWRFPEDRLYGRENLHQAAERILIQAGGINMNTWVIANHPVGHYFSRFASPILSKIAPNRLVSTSPTEAFEQEEYGERVFFMKTRIMTGQLNLAKNQYGDQEFQWLAKEEIQERVTEDYWHHIRNMLVER